MMTYPQDAYDSRCMTLHPIMLSEGAGDWPRSSAILKRRHAGPGDRGAGALQRRHNPHSLGAASCCGIKFRCDNGDSLHEQGGIIAALPRHAPRHDYPHHDLASAIISPEPRRRPATTQETQGMVPTFDP